MPIPEWINQWIEKLDSPIEEFYKEPTPDSGYSQEVYFQANGEWSTEQPPDDTDRGDW